MKTDSNVLISVVVPTCHRPWQLKRCLGALQRQTLAASEYEIIVCDDGRCETTRTAVNDTVMGAPNGPAIHYLRISDSRGPAAARNRGWQRARAPVIAFTDDDTVPDHDWLEAGLYAVSHGADAAAGRILMPLPARPTDIELNAHGLTAAEFSTANCFVRHDVLVAVGGFDERYTMAWREDSDLHFALLENGYQIAWAPAAIVVHPLRTEPFAAGIGMEKKILFDVLLYRKYPGLYRRHIRPGPPWFYLFIIVTLLCAAVGATGGHAQLTTISLALWLGATVLFFLKRLWHSSLTIRNVSELLVTSITIPPLSIFWRLVGACRYGARIP